MQASKGKNHRQWIGRIAGEAVMVDPVGVREGCVLEWHAAVVCETGGGHFLSVGIGLCVIDNVIR